jgi:type IV secretion system protein VirB10
VGRPLAGFLISWSVVATLFAVESDRDFSGNWILDFGRSSVRDLGAEPESFLTLKQTETAIRCATEIDGAEAAWSYRLDGNETRYKVGREARNSVLKWEGAALLINTLVSGAQNYTIMDRWRLSPSHSLLTVNRHIVRAGGEVEGVLVYRRAGADVSDAPAEPRQPATARPPGAAPSAPTLTPRPEAVPAARGEVAVEAGTRVLLALTHSLNTKRSRDGDRVHLKVAFPVSVDDRIVIPRGSTVLGTITEVKGANKGKGDLYIRFDTLTLPDGTTRDLRARPEGGSEGKVAGARDHGKDTRKVATGAGIGTSVGGIAGAAAGHAGAGLGIGGLGGAAAGLGSVMKRPDITLHEGTTVEMVLDRELRF